MAQLLIEFLTEELPPLNLENAVGNSFSDSIYNELSGFITKNSSITTLISPRRFGCIINDIKYTEDNKEIFKKGPSIATAFENDNPSKALIGFAKSCNIAWQDLIKKDDGYFYAKQTIVGQTIEQIIAPAIQRALKKLTIGKYMRWGNNNYSFIRPVHGLVVMYDDKIINLSEPIMGLNSANSTIGHRVMSNGRLTISNTSKYLEQMLNDGKVVVEFNQRKKLIQNSLLQMAKQLNLNIYNMSELIDEVTALVEYPCVLAGEFDPKFLTVPQECLILSMAKNQKYFSLINDNGRLSHKFLFVANIDSPKSNIIIKGNEKVLSARLSDAKFFFDVDKKIPLVKQVDKLSNVLYHNLLGSQKLRIERLQQISSQIAIILNVDEKTAWHTAFLIKADLVTEMVGEFPELQGVMGKYYAINDGESPEIATAIEEHYYPRFSGDILPSSDLGITMALADKLETIVGIWSIGLVPSGDKDPYALRRAALGVVRILLIKNLNLDELIELTINAFNDKLLNKTSPEKQLLKTEIRGFILDRLANYLGQNHKTTCVKSIIKKQKIANTQFTFIPSLITKLEEFASDTNNKPLFEANKRIENILSKSTDIAPSNSLVEQTQYELNLITLLNDFPELNYADNWSLYFQNLSKFNQPITEFFDNVMVMVDNADIRNRRLSILSHCYELFNRYAILSELH